MRAQPDRYHDVLSFAAVNWTGRVDCGTGLDRPKLMAVVGCIGLELAGTLALKH